MNAKVVSIGIVVIVIVAIGGYLIYRNQSRPAAAPQQQAANPTQVQGQDVKVGVGKEAKPGSIVSVLYVGKLQNGTVFDSSAAHGNQPLKFTLGAQGLIPGFQIGVNGMKEGGERLLAIPSALAYGAQAVHQNPQDPNSPIVIPANATLIFDVQLVKVEEATGTAAVPPTTRKK